MQWFSRKSNTPENLLFRLSHKKSINRGLIKINSSNSKVINMKYMTPLLLLLIIMQSNIVFAATTITDNYINTTNITANEKICFIGDCRSSWSLNNIWTGLLGFGNLTAFNLNQVWSGVLGWGNLSGYNLNSVWTGTLGWGNLSGYNLNQVWSNKLGPNNITGGTDGQVLKMSGTTVKWGTGAPTTARYITAGLDPTLTDEVSMPDRIVMYEQFYTKCITCFTMLGTETVSTTDLNVLGIHNFSTAGTIGSDALITFGGVTTTNTNNYNASKTTMFATGFNMSNITGNGRAIMAGLIKTNKNAELWNFSKADTTGIFFFWNSTVGQNWTAYACSGAACTTNDTRVNVSLRYDDLRIMSNGNAGYAEFYINNTMVTNLTTNIPSVNTTAIIGVWTEAKMAKAQDFKINYLYYEANRK